MNTYEKKYNYVLKRAKALKECSLSPRIKDWVDSVFPELKESEDEMIRKWLIAQLELKSDVHNPRDLELMYLKSIAWLEKQGNPADSRIMWHDVSEEPEEMKELLVEWDSEDATWHEIAFYHADTKTFWDGTRQVENVTRWCYIDDIIKKQAQKPKWSKEDEENFNDIDILLFEDKNIPKEKYWKMIDWFRSLKQRMEK